MDSEEDGSPGHRTALWVGITGIAQGWKFVVSLVSSILLGRLLAPSDFGLVATIGPIVAFADLLRDLGFTQAVVQRRDIEPGEISALFWLSVGVTVVLATLLSLSSHVVAVFFHEPRLTLLMVVAAWTLVLGSFSALPIAWLNRKLRFSALALIEICASGAGLAAAVACAWATRSYWSLMVSAVVYSLTAAIMAQVLSGWRPGRPNFGPAVADMARFGAGVSTSNLFNFFARNADNLLIAKADGPALLGLYDRAYKLMLLPISQVTWPVSRVLTPVLTRQRERLGEYRDTYYSAVSYLMIAAQPGLLAVVFFAAPVIHIVLGARWDGVAPIFAWLGLTALMQIASSSYGWLFLSQGRARDLAVTSIVGSIIAVASFLVGLRWGPLGVATAYAVVDLAVRLPFGTWLVGRRGLVSAAGLAKELALPHLTALGAAAATLWVLRARNAEPSALLILFAVVLSYAVYLGALWPWPRKRRLLKLAFDRVQRLARRVPLRGRSAA